MTDSNKPDRNNRPAAGPPKPPGPGRSVFGRGVFLWVLLISLGILLFLLITSNTSRQQKTISLTAFWTALRDDNLKSVGLGTDQIIGEFNKPTQTEAGETRQFKVVVLPANMPGETAEIRRRLLDGTGTYTVKSEYSNDILLSILVPLIPWILIIAFIYFFLFRQIRNASGGAGMLGNFGRSKHRITTKEHTNVTFDDVAGIDEAKDEVGEIVEFLKNPKRFQRLGGRIPRGVLLIGEPGTGKTLLAKAIAGEADVPFFSISGSDFVEMFVGVGASRVRDLFKQAKDNSPCIIFLDEIDAVGRRRGSGFSSGGHDEREQTLNAILVEMDGFDTNDGVIVVAATNRLDVLDPALTRPGRFDRQVQVSLPDVKGRMEVLKVHARKVKLGPNVDLGRLARATPGFSGADLAAIINESALAATLHDKQFIEQDDLEEARDKVRWGRARKSRVIDEKDKLATAYHEAGHAVVQWLEAENADPIHKVTIIPRGNFGGATMTLPEKDRTSYSRKWSLSFIRMGLAGRIAEEMFTGDINTGAGGDIRQVTTLARKMVRDWGMNDRVGFVYYGDDENQMNAFGMSGREYSEETARIIDEEVKKLIDGLEAETKKLLLDNRERVEALAKGLMKYETLDADDVDKIMRGQLPNKPSISEMLGGGGNNRSGTTIQPSTDPNTPNITLGGGFNPQPG